MEKYWSSLEQFNKDPEFIKNSEKEFLSSPLQEDEGGKSGVGRRDFMKLMAASTALASSACFQRPAREILPYVNQPEEITFGKANYYASTCQECGAACGTLIKTREGRPIKIEGNPDHPLNQGGLCSRGQASILNLYDPDRIKGPGTTERGSNAITASSWDEVDRAIRGKLASAKGKVRVLTGNINSPATQSLINDFVKMYNGKHVSYEPINQAQIIQGQQASYGRKVLPRYRFDKADLVVSIDADFLGTWLSPVEFTKQFTKGRKLSKKKQTLNRLVVFESIMSVTGSNADERVPMTPNQGAHIALALANELISAHGHSAPASAKELTKGFSAEAVATAVGCSADVIKKTAKELHENRRKSLVVAGSTHAQSENGLALQIAVNFLNSTLGNDGISVDTTNSPSLQSSSSYDEMTELIKEMKEGKVAALLVAGTNPSYSLSAEEGFDEAAQKVGLVVSFNDRGDETSVVSDFVLPNSHALESWSDAEPQKGLFSLAQPTIRPIYDTRSFQDSLLNLMGKSGDFHKYLQVYWQKNIFGLTGKSVAFKTFWEGALRDGVVDTRKNPGATSGGRSFKAAALKKPASGKEGFELAFYASGSMYDGRHANNPWLLELPDPISKITWDNFASVSPATAKKHHLKDGDMVKITTNEKTFQIPAFVQPGLHSSVIAIALGFGRAYAGEVGSKIGKNGFSFVWNNQFSGQSAALKKTGAKYQLASTQTQHSLHGRPIVKEATLAAFLEDPHAGNHSHHPTGTLWPEYKYKSYRWGMAIDLNSCTGCNACVIGCQSENNVPVVGKDSVAKGRIMHWIRIDRYYTGTPDNPAVVHQPMLCQHCENAPCETVCPVIATSHSDEGLNQQTYNRCVGTRYCANNCPYKVRRFNWFDYNYRPDRSYNHTHYPRNLAQNPEVTVRSRGVMEKCTFCVQRISEAKNTAKDLGKKVGDGDVKTACQQSCPADAIVFGDMNDPNSRIAKMQKNPRGYHVLEETNVKPSVTYLTKIRNAEKV